MRDTELANTKRYLVLGATGGIGSSLCRHLHASGCELFLAASGKSNLERLGREVKSPWLAIDAHDLNDIDRAFRACLEVSGHLDGVVNCIGSMVLNPAHLVSDQEWAEVIQVNLGSAFATVRAAAGALMKGGGSVVLLSAAAAEIGLANHEAIAAAKAGVAGLTRAAAATYSKKGIRVNCVAPGFVRTSLTSQVICGERALKTSESMHALGRLGTPDDIAFAIKWLLSDESSWVTGQVISVDGGLSSVLAR